MDIKIYCTDDRVERGRVGNKAFPLFTIAHLCNVPPFVCIDSNAFRLLLDRDENNELKNMLYKLIALKDNVSERLQEISEKVLDMYVPMYVIKELEKQLVLKGIPGPFAVRSSSVLEDNTYHSGAGIFESYTDISQRDGIINYVKACWASQFSMKAWAYLKYIDSIDQLQMGILIQNYQKALKSGVLFSVDPINSENGMRMEIVDGNAERFMLGELSAENTVFCTVNQEGLKLSSKEKVGWQYDLFQIGDRLRRLMGYEVDVEWVYDGTQVYILQCRPVTRVINVSESEWLKEIGSIAGIPTQDLNLLKNDIKPRDIVNEKSIRNALTVDMALGCSTNSVLHLTAIANEAKLEMNLDIINEMSSKVPNLCKLAPASNIHIQDLYEAGGISAVINELSKKDLIDLECITATGKTIGENVKDKKVLNYDVIKHVEKPYSETGGIAVLRGNLAVDGAVVKREVETGLTTNLEIEIKKGVEEGEQVITETGGEVFEGMPVSTRPAD